jgi:DnaJ-class molecular chaperone
MLLSNAAGKGKPDNNGEIAVNDKIPVPCQHCHGTGINAGIECRECGGKGHRVVIAGRIVNAPKPNRPERWRGKPSIPRK